MTDQLVKRKFAGLLLSPTNNKSGGETTPEIGAAASGTASTIVDGVKVVGVGEQLDAATSVETKEKKRRIRIDDDDESPTFNPMARGIKTRGRGRGRGSRGGIGGRGAMRGGLTTPRSGSLSLLSTPEKSRDAAVFTSPEGKVCFIDCFFII